MKLLDVRKLAVKQQSRVRFRMSNGMECVITERGLSQAPEFKGVPESNVEEELSRASRFVIEPADAKDKSKSRTVNREELEALAATVSGGKAREEHEE